ncbi:hypothetical protein CPB84DRAFT_1680801, partial [Gymnopilus junonius]
DLERQVFGGSDSELSSDEEEDIQQQQQIHQQKPLPPPPSRPTKPPRDEYESSEGGSEDEYVQERPSEPKPKKRIRKPAAVAAEDGEPKVTRKRKRKQPVETDLSELPPEQVQMEMKIDAILRGGKKPSRQRKKKNEEVLDSFADDEVARLREAMVNAADEDIRSNEDKMPATGKLKLLPEAMETLRKASLAQSMIDNNLLEAVRRWLEPLPDRSLPALNIQREFFNIIKKMEFIDSAVLKESGLGRIVLFYTKCKRVTPDVQRIANDLVSTWSRPIIKRSASYRDRIVPIAQDADVDMRAGEKLNAILARAKESEKGRVRENAVMIPQRSLGTYTVAPKTNGGINRGNVSVDVDIERRRKNAERMRSLTRKKGIRTVLRALSCRHPSFLSSMQSRRGTGLTPLAVIQPRRRSSLLSLNSAASPHTPRSCPSPSLPIFYPANRNSADSWNSSNPDDAEFDWKQDQVLLLSRTLDALPAHLVTPFNGPVPPSNLLDKIARGVSQAKGPLDWPHSIRATRVKLLELARTRAKEDAVVNQRRHVIQEEVEVVDSSHYSYFHDGEDKPLTADAVGPRRPAYRQSSMDFIKPSPAELKDNANIARLSNRLQRSDRIFPNPSYHPYSRIPRPQARSSSPSNSSDIPPLVNPATPSSSTLNSFSSLSSAPRLQRSVSTMSSGTLFSSNGSSDGMPLDTLPQRLGRSDSFSSGAPPAPPPKDLPPQRAGYKRAPSYGALAQEARDEAKATDRVHERKLSGSYPSSDEEEKARTTRAKKIKTKIGAPAVSSPVASEPPSSEPPSPARQGSDTTPSSPIVPIAKAPVPPAKDKMMSPKSKSAPEHGKVKSSPKALKSTKADKDKDSSSRPRPAPMNLQRNPSMFGAELPHLRNNNTGGLDLPLAPSSTFIPAPIVTKARLPSLSHSHSRVAPVPALTPSMDVDMSSSPPPLSPAPSLSPSSPTTQRVRTLRRVRRLAPARRISFSSLVAPGDEADADGEGEMTLSSGNGKGCLGSAFQLL